MIGPALNNAIFFAGIFYGMILINAIFFIELLVVNIEYFCMYIDNMKPACVNVFDFLN